VQLFTLFFVIVSNVIGQYAPAAKEEGSTAIHKDSSVFVGWATECITERGYIKISDTTFTYEEKNIASNGNDTNAIAKADGRVVSLGDNGNAILTFEHPIINGDGFDFAVFENSFRSQEPPQNYFIELAFVEVSSDGQRYVRFPSASESQTNTQIETFGQLDPTKIHNLAGKYITHYGTPFDLEDLKDSTGIDLQNITHVKIIDVVGSINENYGSYDSKGNIINDPYPTPFATGGFDLDAVGVIHMDETQTSTNFNTISNKAKIYPNPVKIGQNITVNISHIENLEYPISIKTFDLTGKLIHTAEVNSEKSTRINTRQLSKGIYLIQIPELQITKKVIVTE
jgi:hypothetical protein